MSRARRRGGVADPAAGSRGLRRPRTTNRPKCVGHGASSVPNMATDGVAARSWPRRSSSRFSLSVSFFLRRSFVEADGVVLLAAVLEARPPRQRGRDLGYLHDGTLQDLQRGLPRVLEGGPSLRGEAPGTAATRASWLRRSATRHGRASASRGPRPSVRLPRCGPAAPSHRADHEHGRAGTRRAGAVRAPTAGPPRSPGGRGRSPCPRQPRAACGAGGRVGVLGGIRVGDGS